MSLSKMDLMAFSALPLFFSRIYTHRCLSPTPIPELPPKLRALSVKSSHFGTKIAPITATLNPSQYRRRPTNLSMASGTTPSVAATKGDSKLLVLENEEEMADSLAKYTSDLSEKFCRERGAFAVVLSGGSLVKSLRKLVEAPSKDSIDWGKWHIFWVDERVVPKDHPDSNYNLAINTFLSKVQIPANQIYAIDDSLSASAAADDYESRLKYLMANGVVRQSPAIGFPQFDLLLLGMGPDGHIASLFPQHPLLSENERWVSSINDSPKPPPERITFTFPVINSSSHVAIVVAGAGKADAVSQVFRGEKTTSALPVQMVELKDGELTWFADKAAVSKL